MKVLTGGMTELSTVDYPRHVASVLYLCGCPYRCPFCHNGTILDTKNCRQVETGEIVDRVLKNYPLVSGACITGGEPMLQQEGVAEICEGLRDGKIDVKLDTNGFYPERLEKILNVIDFVAMDIKAPLDPKKYSDAVGRRDGSEVLSKVKKTLDIILRGGVNAEIRTTIVPMLVYKKDDILSIANSLKEQGADSYVLQQFRPDGGCLDKTYESYASPPRDYILDIAREVKKVIPNVTIRTKEKGEEVV